jgi:hypothetical protein
MIGGEVFTEEQAWMMGESKIYVVRMSNKNLQMFH